MKKLFLAIIIFLAAACNHKAVVPVSPQPVACTMEAKQCPDGSYVGRIGPNCEFAACPITPTPAPPPSPKPSPTPIPQSSTSGITGQVLIGPTCPVERIPPDPACADKGYQATIIVKTADGQTEITSFTSNTDGTFTVNLNPGTYLLVPTSTNTLPRGSEQTVVVEKDKFTQVTISYDSGIR